MRITAESHTSWVEQKHIKKSKVKSHHIQNISEEEAMDWPWFWKEVIAPRGVLFMQKLVMVSRVWTRFSEPLNKWERKKEKKIESKVKPKESDFFKSLLNRDGQNTSIFKKTGK